MPAYKDLASRTIGDTAGPNGSLQGTMSPLDFLPYERLPGMLGRGAVRAGRFAIDPFNIEEKYAPFFWQNRRPRTTPPENLPPWHPESSLRDDLFLRRSDKEMDAFKESLVEHRVNQKRIEAMEQKNRDISAELDMVQKIREMLHNE